MRRSRRLFQAAVAVSVICGSTTFAPAALISSDLNTPGDGLLTRDTASRLEWLDLTQSTGLSWDQVEAGASGFLAQGFRHATAAEVRSVLDQLGFGAPSAVSSLYYQPAVNFLELFGCTSSCTVGSGLIQPTAPPFQPGIFAYAIDANTQGSSPPVGSWSIGVFDSFVASETRGHFLVRVPEASPLSLLILLLLPLGLVRATWRIYTRDLSLRPMHPNLE